MPGQGLTMKVLHVGWGLKPWWSGGYIEYLMGLFDFQTKMGYDTSYFCAGRYYGGFKKPTLIKWRMGKIKVYEAFNTPFMDNGGGFLLKPGLDLSNAECETIFREALNEIKPDIVHIQHLMGLPLSLVNIIKDEYGLPIVMTIHDYYLMCPTISLFDRESGNCPAGRSGHKCGDCMERNGLRINYRKVGTYAEATSYGFYKLCRKAGRLRKAFTAQRDPMRYPLSIPDNDYFEKRRLLNRESLLKIDALVSPSKKTAKIISDFAGSTVNISIVPCSLSHVDGIKPEMIEAISLPIKFVVLGGCANHLKGANLISETILSLNNDGYKDSFQIYIYGDIDPEFKNNVPTDVNVFFRGPYKTTSLNGILSGMHVGIVPSVWEEVYGIVGIELLAKGIPVIGNLRGGITDYVANGETGWINRSSSADELKDIIKNIINDPGQILQLNRKILSGRRSLITSMEDHFKIMDGIYAHTITESSGKKHNP